MRAALPTPLEAEVKNMLTRVEALSGLRAWSPQNSKILDISLATGAGKEQHCRDVDQLSQTKKNTSTNSRSSNKASAAPKQRQSLHCLQSHLTRTFRLSRRRPGPEQARHLRGQFRMHGGQIQGGTVVFVNSQNSLGPARTQGSWQVARAPNQAFDRHRCPPRAFTVLLNSTQLIGSA